MINRRYFIKKTSASFISSFIFPPDLKSTIKTNDSKTITILHTNDVHSHIDPFPVNDASFPNSGGVVARSVLINKLRKINPNTLLFDAGDIFQGTPYFNFFGGEIELKLMSKMGYNAATLGNHEFDNGVDHLANSLENANFSIINSNYVTYGTALENKIERFKIFEIDDVKIGVFGLGIDLKGLVEKKLYEGVKYLDPIGISNEVSEHLKEKEDCKIIICLSHLGYKINYDKGGMCDLLLAEKTKNIDLIIGGHSHTFMEKPAIVKNLIGKNVLINQVGCFGINLGKVDFHLSIEKSKTESHILKI